MGIIFAREWDVIAGGPMYRQGLNPAVSADVSDMELAVLRQSSGSSTALAKVEDVSLARIMDSETARAYIQKVSVPADDAGPYKVKLGTSISDDQAKYDALVKDEKQKFRKGTRLLARLFGKAEFKPSRDEPEKSTKTQLLEGIVLMSDKLQRDVQAFADIPAALERNRGTYAELLQKEAAVRKQIEGYRETYSGVLEMLQAVGLLKRYDALTDDKKEAAKRIFQKDVSIDVDVLEVRQIFCANVEPEAEKLKAKIEIDFPFARESYLSIQRRMKDIEQYDASDVKEKFVPAMLALHKLKLRYDEAKVKADTTAPAADLDGIIRSCNELVEETDRILERVQIEADVDREMREDAKQIEEEKPVDMLSEMDFLLGKPSAEYAPVQPPKEEVIIEAEYTEVGKKEV
ncbi:MAG: hypothetical protein PHO02_05800 [Candidatus Nanoarchaeia archaeon]|nr:hypothetical protein [Candidatus Nanoarchaeia archaeon]